MGAARILVVEDDHLSARVIENRLTRMGYEVTTCTGNGDEALHFARNIKPDLVLMDIGLKEQQDGVEIAGKIRAARDVPVIYLTGRDDEETLRRARETGPYGYILKPFEVRELSSTIEIALYKYHLDQKLRDSEARLRWITENMIDQITYIDKQRLISYASPSIKLLLGYNPEDLIGRPVTDFIHPDDHAKILEHFHSARRERESSIRLEYRGIDKQNRTVWVETQGHLLYDETGVFEGAVFGSRDVSDRKKAEETIRHRLEIEEVVTSISTQFINLSSGEVGQEITRTLRLVGELAMADRAFLNLFAGETRLIDQHYEWNKSEVYPPTNLSENALANLRWLIKELECSDVVMVDNLDNLPDEAGPEKIFWQSLHARSILSIPMRSRGRLIGFFGFSSFHSGNRWQPEDIRMLKLVAEVFINALERKKDRDTLEKRVRDRTRELTALYWVASYATESLDLNIFLERCLSLVLDTLGRNQGAIQLLDEAGENLSLAIYHGSEEVPESIAGVHPLSEGLSGWAVAQRQSVMLEDISTDPRAWPVSQGASRGAYLAVPMQASGEIMGVVSVFGAAGEPPFFDADQALLVAIAGQIGMAVFNERLRQQAAQSLLVKERQRLARQLHDSVTQLLYSLVLFAGAGREAGRQGDLEKLASQVSRMDTVAQQALKEMRLFIHQLRPSELAEVGLEAAIDQRLDSVERRANVTATLHTSLEVDIPRKMQEDIYYIIQEALNNSLKYSGASKVDVILISNEDSINVEIYDNGFGFNPSEAFNSGGIGLKSMQERAAGLGGEVTIESSPGQGTAIKIFIGMSGSQAYW